MAGHRLSLLFSIVAAAFALAPVQAQERTPWPWPSEVFNPPKHANIPGNFDYYLLVLSWSPTHCMEVSSGQDVMQCARRDGKRFGFVLHGLWPQYEKGYPERCHTRWRPFVPELVINQMRDVMPSRGLVIHEYRTHGTCSGLRPAPYFALGRRLFDRIKIPQRFRNPFDMQSVAPREVLRDFLRINPELSPDMISVSCGDSGNWLHEVRICLTKDGRPRRCSASAYPRTPCRASKMHVPAVRSTWRPGRSRALGDSDKPLPRPPLIESPSPF